MDRPHRGHVALDAVGVDGFGHPAHEQVLPEPVDEPPVQGLRERLVGPLFGGQLAEARVAERVEELEERQWSQVEEVDLADREGAGLGHAHAEQRAGGGEVDVGGTFAEVLQAADCGVRDLDLVEDQQRTLGVDGAPGVGRELTKQRCRLPRCLEQRAESGVLLEVQVVGAGELSGAEVAQQPGLAHLAGAPEQQRLSPGRAFPRAQVLLEIASQWPTSNTHVLCAPPPLLQTSLVYRRRFWPRRDGGQRMTT